MKQTGNRQRATALAYWYIGLPLAEQIKLNEDLLTKAPPAVGINFTDSLRDMTELKLVTVNYFKLHYGVAFSLDGGPMGAVKFLGHYKMAYA